MAVPLARGASGVVLLTLPSPATAVTAQWLDPTGKVVDDDLDVELEDFTAPTVVEVVERNVVELSGVGDLYPDQVVWWDPQGRTTGAAVRISEIDLADDVVTLEAAPPGAFAENDELKPLHARVDVPDTLTADLGLHYRIEWSADLADGSTHRDRVMCHVVSTPFPPAVSAAEVRRYADGLHASVDLGAGWYREVARRASARVERKLVASGRLPHLIGDRELFADAGLCALRLELADEGLIPQGQDPQMWREAQTAALNAAIEEAVASVWVDRDQSGDTTAADAIKPGRSISLVRVS